MMEQSGFRVVFSGDICYNVRVKTDSEEEETMQALTERKGKLKNGSSLVTFSAPHLHSVAFAVVLPFVPDGTPGIYHLIEHLFFEKAGVRRADEINAEMTSRGSEIMGYTSIQYMCFNFTCRQEVFRDQLCLLYDMLREQDFGQEELDKVLPVIRNEIFEYNFYDSRASDLLRELWFDSRFINSVLGSSSVLDGLTLEEIKEERGKLFTKDMCLFLAGAFEKEDVQKVLDTFGELPLHSVHREPPRQEEKVVKEINKIGHGRELQVLVTYHVEKASKDLKMAVHWLRSALFDGLDAAFYRFFNERGFRFYSVDGNYNIRGDELIFSYLVHIEKKDKKRFEPLVFEFEEYAAKTPFLSLVKPYLHDNIVFLYDNPERLCSHYVDTWADFSAPVTLQESLDVCGSFTDEKLAGFWKEICSSLRRIFYIGR